MKDSILQEAKDAKEESQLSGDEGTDSPRMSVAAFNVSVDAVVEDAVSDPLLPLDMIDTELKQESSSTSGLEAVLEG